MPILIFSYDWNQLKTDTDIYINTDADTDIVLADTDMIKTDIDISVTTKNIGQPIYRFISIYCIAEIGWYDGIHQIDEINSSRWNLIF